MGDVTSVPEFAAVAGVPIGTSHLGIVQEKTGQSELSHAWILPRLPINRLKSKRTDVGIYANRLAQRARLLQVLELPPAHSADPHSTPLVGPIRPILGWRSYPSVIR